jgi:hypothetical protein
MVFFTRQLYLGIQPKSGWERRAEREWDRRRGIYVRYLEVIAPLLPPAVRRLCRASLHDAVVQEVTQDGDELILLLDATNALSRFRGRHVRLTFRGVRGRVPTDGLVGQWWLCEEAHLCSRARFNLQVLFETSEMEVEADELVIERVPRGRG